MTNDNDWTWGILMMVIWIVFFIIIAAVIAYQLKRDVGSLGKTTPLDIAKKRYANGEISKEQFEELIKDLKKYGKLTD